MADSLVFRGQLSGHRNWVIRDFKDTAYPFFELDTSFLECCLCCLYSPMK